MNIEISYIWDEFTTISKEVNGNLSGGLYDFEYPRGMNFVAISQSGKNAFVAQCLKLFSTWIDMSNTADILLLTDENPQVFVLLDMEIGNIIKTYTIDIGSYFYCINTQFSDDDSHAIIYFIFDDGGN